MEKQEYMLIALASSKGVGRKTIRAARALGETVDFSRYSPGEIQKMLPVAPGVAEQIRAGFSMEKARQLVETWNRKGIGVLTLQHSAYPPLLREIPDPPEILYIAGDIQSLHRPCISLVGSRKPTTYGKNTARQFARELSERGITVVSGMARGIDSEAHRGALAGGGTTVAVLGCGVDVTYPAENRSLALEIRKQGAIVSEYPPGTAPQRGFFPERNRIISGLAKGVLVVEAASRSGSLITADLAADQGRDVFAIPGSIYAPQSAGCHWLIQQGSKLVQNTHDILSEYPELVSDTNGKTAANTCSMPSVLTAEELAVLDLIGSEAVSYDKILCRTAFSTSYLHYLLLSLQVKQCIMQLPGPSFVRIKNK
ncbi:DNA-processing protein DprA [Aneurinibacillus sp. BA2021]|nr:DNA-processing protein DprA [Aneurinibacillus sp. BA2021]